MMEIVKQLPISLLHYLTSASTPRLCETILHRIIGLNVCSQMYLLSLKNILLNQFTKLQLNNCRIKVGAPRETHLIQLVESSYSD